MIYISAQPAEQYFLWQLEIQLQNFQDIGIPAESIHVLLAFNPKTGISEIFKKFTSENTQAQFFFYPDNREKSNYLSSIRPHILSQHFKRFKTLSESVICYHDSDILFRERLDESLLSKTSFWYFGDTRNYVSFDYLAKYGKSFLFGLCKVAEIDPKIIEVNKEHSGGAQHVMKDVDEKFWSDVEIFSEAIFDYIESFNSSIKSSANKVQAWCADMWAVLWTAWKHNKEVRIHRELNFSWPKEHISQYYKSKILHNSGVFSADKSDYFCKLLFKESDPYHIDFSKIKKDRCSTVYTGEIDRISKLKEKPSLKDITLILVLRDAINLTQQDRIEHYINYLCKHVVVEIHVVEMGNWPVFNQHLAKGKAKYTFIGENNIDSYILRRVKTGYFLYIDANILLPVDNIMATAELLYQSDNAIVLPMDQIIELSNKQYDLFKDTLTKGLEKRDNYGEKKRLDFIESFGISRQKYLSSGGNNKYWHFYTEDGFNLERQIRYGLLGITIKIIEKHAFKLFFWDHKPESLSRNSLEKYLVAAKSTKDDIKRNMAHGNYQYNRSYRKINRVDKLAFGICSLRENIDTSSIKKALTKYEPVSIDQLQVNYNVEFNLVFNRIIEISQEAKLDYIILINENLEINEENIGLFWRTIERMEYYGLQILSAISDRNFKKEKVIGPQLFHVESLPHSPAFLIHKTLFKKILTNKFNPHQRLELYLNSISEHIGMMAPFLGKPKTVTPDSKDFQAINDRVELIENLEDELMWKFNTLKEVII